MKGSVMEEKFQSCICVLKQDIDSIRAEKEHFVHSVVSVCEQADNVLFSTYLNIKMTEPFVAREERKRCEKLL